MFKNQNVFDLLYLIIFSVKWLHSGFNLLESKTKLVTRFLWEKGKDEKKEFVYSRRDSNWLCK